MTRKKKQIERRYFNREETLLVVTSYPDLRKEKVGSFVQSRRKILRALSRRQQVIVLAERTGSKQTFNETKHLRVSRVWNSKNPFSLFLIFPHLVKYDKVHTILFQFDQDVFKNILYTITLPLILLILKYSRKQIVFEIRQKPSELDFILRFLYKVIGTLSNKVITSTHATAPLTSLINHEKLIVFTSKSQYLPSNFLLKLK